MLGSKHPEDAPIASFPAHRVLPGNRPSHFFLCDVLTPERLGALLAIYEHKVFVLSVLLNINPFDQWGVELGKRFAREVLTGLHDAQETHLDPSTEGLMECYRHKKG